MDGYLKKILTQYLVVLGVQDAVQWQQRPTCSALTLETHLSMSNDEAKASRRRDLKVREVQYTYSRKILLQISRRQAGRKMTFQID